MATFSLQTGVRGSVLSLEDGVLCVNAARYRGLGEFAQLSSCSTSGQAPLLRTSSYPWDLNRRKRNRRHVSRISSFLNQFPPVTDDGFGQMLGQSVEKIGVVAQTVLDTTTTSLKRIAGDLDKVPLPAQAAEEISKSLDKMQDALRQVAIDPHGAERVIKLSVERVQSIVGELATTTSSSVGTLGTSFETAKEALGSSGFNLQKRIGEIGLPNAIVQQKLQSIWQTIATSGSPLAGPHSGVQLVAQTPYGLQQDASNSAIRSSPSLEHLAHSASGVLHQTQLLTTDLGLQASNLVNGIAHLDLSSFQASADQLTISAGNMMGEIATAMGGPYFVTSTSTATLVAATAGSVAIVVSSASLVKPKGFTEGEDLPLRYDPQSITAYFRRRPMDIIFRAVTIALQCSALAASILLDFSSGKGKQNELLRAAQLVDLIARLGPTAIKIGQALSIRPDILPIAYLEELQKLQDRVPPFPNVEARQSIQEGLGKPAEEVFEDISPDPIAAASLGQVYKARLKETGQAVAVKVQRPGVLEGISRDLFILRTTAYALQKLPMVQSDLVSLLDNWAIRFFDELDYVQEAKNAQRFAEDMKGLPNVTVPDAYLSYTSRKVLTSEWVDGEKLSDSKAADLLPLVTVALNCYLIQLLESGFLHADPHPGNLLRTPDGRLCVLDFGLMTEVTEEQRYTLIEYISHLVNSDYARVAEDLVRLGFVPPEFVDPEKTAAVVPQLSRVLGQLVQGGGARKVNVGQVIDDLAKISEDYVFVIPPYFALILRAFSVLEGIGLEADPDYTIVEECYPYISKRLITDDSARTRAALKYFLYGGKDQLDVQRVEDIAGGFRTFRDLMAPVAIASSDDNQKPRSSIDPSTKQALLLVFAPEGSYLQELLLTELVRSVDALSREARAVFWHLLATSLRLPVPAAMAAPGSWPLFLPALFLGSSPVASLSSEDQEALDTVRRLWSLFEPQLSQPSAADIVETAQDLMPLLRQLFPGVTTATQRFVVMLLQRQALRLADDLDGRNSIRQWNADPAAYARKISPINFF